LREYCKLANLDVFNIVPLTFIISHGLQDPDYNQIVTYFS